MRIARLAELLTLKYKLAISPDELENSLRSKATILWNYPNKSYNILKACAESGVSKPQNSDERKAVEGYKFCKKLLNMIDYLKVNQSKANLGELREVLLNIVNLIENNKDLSFKDGKINKGETSYTQFSHVSELIFQLIPISKKHDIKLRNEQFNKAKTGLSRILSVALDMLDDIQKLEVMVPEKFTHKNVTKTDISAELPERFTPQRAPLSEYDIIDFIRQYGDQYGISSKEDWLIAFRNDPQLKEQMTTVINALNRGHSPKDAGTVKMQIAEILKGYEERKVNNSNLFEETE